jgi:NADPH2 dehydrogenase
LDIWDKTSPVLLAGGFLADSAKDTVDHRYKDKDVAVVFGRYFISNPDLPFKLKQGVELTKYNRETFYKVGSKDGYIDYPFSKEFEAHEKGLLLAKA